ncbi:hypothetical protein LC593_21765 [Nostoc sp. CHAB 5844]|nr:hypothetical protein [Nostoc sp. CHAB 5844]
MTVGKADDTCFNALNPRNAVSPQRTAHRNALAPLPLWRRYSEAVTRGKIA